jgi:hypothetical protein
VDGWNICNKNQDDEAQDWDMSNNNAIILQNFTQFGSAFLTFLSVYHSGLLLTKILPFPPSLIKSGIAQLV